MTTTFTSGVNFTNIMALVVILPFRFTNKNMPNFTSTHGKKILSTLMLFTMRQQDWHQTTGVKGACRMLIKLSPRGQFTNILRTMLCTQLFLCLHFRFVLYWGKTFGAKAVRRTLMKLSPDLLRNASTCRHAYNNRVFGFRLSTDIFKVIFHTS